MWYILIVGYFILSFVIKYFMKKYKEERAIPNTQAGSNASDKKPAQGGGDKKSPQGGGGDKKGGGPPPKK